MRLPDALTKPTADNTFCGTFGAQTWNDLAIWEEFFNRYPIASIIELGTWKGGMAAFFAVQGLARGFQFTTLDNNGSWQENRELVGRLGGTYIVANVFDLDYMTKLIRDQPKPLLLFCDNGDKRRELREIGALLSEGDYVAVHDWGSEADQGDIPDAWCYLLQEECEEMGSLTRYFKFRLS